MGGILAGKRVCRAMARRATSGLQRLHGPWPASVLTDMIRRARALRAKECSDVRTRI